VSGSADAQWNQRARNETPTERLDRNWEDLLQELRVAQTGVQLLTGLLLSAVFQQRFTELTDGFRVVYLVTVSMSVLATAALIAPVAMHRALFRKRARDSLVQAGQRMAVAGLALLALAVAGVMTLIFGVVAGTTAGVLAAIATTLVFAVLWAALPFAYRRRHPGPD